MLNAAYIHPQAHNKILGKQQEVFAIAVFTGTKLVLKGHFHEKSV
jgi:hypothetical protein